MKKLKNKLIQEKNLKRKIEMRKNNSICKYKYIIILLVLIIIRIKAQYLRELDDINEFNEIKITIDKNKNNNITNIINSAYQEFISAIIINEVPQSSINITLPELEDDIINITIKFNSLLTSCASMFYELSNII